jgi:phenylacetate-CoA oxygenase PaaI subunit
VSQEFESVGQLPENAKQPFHDLMLVLADCKHILGLRYGEWLGAPAIEASISAVAMAQDEFGHARLFYGIVEEFTKEGFPEREEIPSQYRNTEIIDSEFETWMDFIAANALVDLALTVQIEAFASSSYLPMRRMIGKITLEERFHLQHSQGWLLRIVEESEKSKGNMEKAIQKIWEPVMKWLGDPDSASEKALIDAGLQSSNSGDLRKRLIELISPVLEKANINLPNSNEMSWNGWDAGTRRSNSNGPDSETFAQIETFFGHEYPVGS